MDNASPQDTYAKHLRQPYGYPLRTPEPSPMLPDSYQYDGLQIGDVGYVDTHGRFQVLFNLRYSSTHELHRKRGVPDQFEPIELDLDEVSDVNSNELPKDCIISSGVEQPHRNKDDPKTTYEFLSSATSGAILMLPSGAVRHDLREKDDLRNIAREKAHHWCSFAKRDSLYLITGLYKTSSWTLASFDYAPRRGQIIVERDNDGTYSWDCRFNVDRRHSPRGNDNRNQTVLITGFKIAIRWWAQEPMVEWVPRSQSIWSGLFAHLCWLVNVLLSMLKTIWRSLLLRSLEHVPKLSQPYHPSDVINRYLLDKDPKAQVAITHDSQWISMLEEEELTQEDLAQENRLRGFLSERYISASDGDAVYLRRKFECEGVPFETLETAEGFSLPVPSANCSAFVVTNMRAENIVPILKRMPIGFYVTIQFDGTTRKTENKSVLVRDSIVEWAEEIHLPLDPSVLFRFTVCASFEFDPMLGNGQVLLTKEMRINDLVGSTYLITPSAAEAGPSCSSPSLLVTLERRPFKHFMTHPNRDDYSPHWEMSSALAHETDLGHNALLRYQKDYRKEDFEKSVEHFERALVLCPYTHECRAAALSNLAMAKFISCQVNGTYTELNAPVSLYRQALDLRPDGHPDRPATLLNLAQVLCCSYGKLGYDEFVSQEIKELIADVRGICPEGTHERRAATLVLQTCAMYKSESSTSSAAHQKFISDLVSDIRALPGLRFLEQLLVSRLEKVASHGAVVNGSQRSCDPLIVLRGHDPLHFPITIAKTRVSALTSWCRSFVTASEDEDTEDSDVLLFLRNGWSLVVVVPTEVIREFQPLDTRILSPRIIMLSLPRLPHTNPTRAQQISIPQCTLEWWKDFLAADPLLFPVEDGSSVARKLTRSALMRRIVRSAAGTCVEGQDANVLIVVEEPNKDSIHSDFTALANSQRSFEAVLIFGVGRLEMEEIIQRAKFASLSNSCATHGDEESRSPSDETLHPAAAIQCAWDTVSCVGLVKAHILPTSSSTTHTCRFFHAGSLDECRVKFMREYFRKTNLWIDNQKAGFIFFPSNVGLDDILSNFSNAIPSDTEKTTEIKEGWHDVSHTDLCIPAELRQQKPCLPVTGERCHTGKLAKVVKDGNNKYYKLTRKMH